MSQTNDTNASVEQTEIKTLLAQNAELIAALKDVSQRLTPEPKETPTEAAKRIKAERAKEAAALHPEGSLTRDAQIARASRDARITEELRRLAQGLPAVEPVAPPAPVGLTAKALAWRR